MRIENETIHLDADCPVEAAEPLAAALEGGARTVDLSVVRRMHSAVVQTLLHYRPTLVGAFEEPTLRALILPALPAPKEPMAKLGG